MVGRGYHVRRLRGRRYPCGEKETYVPARTLGSLLQCRMKASSKERSFEAGTATLRPRATKAAVRMVERGRSRMVAVVRIIVYVITEGAEISIAIGAGLHEYISLSCTCRFESAKRKVGLVGRCGGSVASREHPEARGDS